MHDYPPSASSDTPARKQSKLVPLTLIALGATAVVAPFFLLRRVRLRRTVSVNAGNAVNEKDMAPPEVRTRLAAVALRAAEPQGRQAPGRAPPPSGALLGLKALGVATCVVGVSAAAAVWAARWSLGVQNTEEFATRMRAKMLDIAPSLRARIYGPDSPTHAPLLDASPPVPDGEWTWADANERLARAYEEGGAGRWLEVAEQELELEVGAERRRRGESGGESGRVGNES